MSSTITIPLKRVKNFVESLPTTTRYLFLVGVAAVLIAAAYYIYKTYVLPKRDASFIEGYASGMNKRNNNDGSDVATLYLFKVDWCPHCKHALPVWNELTSEYTNKTFNGNKVQFVLVDCDKDPALADKFNIQGYPTIKLDKFGEIIEYKAKPNKDTLVEFLNKAFSS